MPSLSEEVTIPSPPEVVWPLLADPGLVASCIPGATVTPTIVAGTYEGTLRVSFGPTVAVFRGEARLAYDHEARCVTVEGRASDGRGHSRAVASGMVSAGGIDQTVLKVEGSFSVTGPLETVANAGGIAVARGLLAEFAANMAKLLTTEGTPAPEAEEIPMVEPETVARQARAVAAMMVAAPQPEPRGGVLLWRASLDWLRQVFSRQG
jgi:uncharacterized protein